MRAMSDVKVRCVREGVPTHCRSILTVMRASGRMIEVLRDVMGGRRVATALIGVTHSRTSPGLSGVSLF